MPIRADQLREKEDYQQLIIERQVQDNKYRERPNTAYSAGLAMDTEMLLEQVKMVVILMVFLVRDYSQVRDLLLSMLL